jgi:hypothetical protein
MPLDEKAGDAGLVSEEPVVVVAWRNPVALESQKVDQLMQVIDVEVNTGEYRSSTGD